MEFFAQESSMSLRCHGWKMLAENFLLILASGSLMAFVGVKANSWRNNRRVRQASQSLYQQLKQDLQRQGRGVGGIGEADMLERFRGLSGHDSVGRDERTFSSKIMPLIEGLRKNDKTITKSQKIKFGKAEQVWQLK